jgi:hypothetical protein
VDRIVEKIENWAHSEYNRPEIKDKAWISEAINAPKDVLKRNGINLKFVPFDESFPRYVRNNIDRFRSMIKPV